MSEFFCPICSSRTMHARKEESFPFMNVHVMSYGWACPRCHWTELLSIENPKEEDPIPTPRGEGISGEFRVRLAMFVQQAEDNGFPTEARAAIDKWAGLCKNIYAQERRIRKMVGLVDHKPQTDIDIRFQALLAKK